MLARFAFALLGVLAVGAPAWAADPVQLKLSFFASDTEVTYARAIKPWIDAVNADPSAAIKIEAYPNGALGKSLPAQPQMLLDGVADIAFVNPALVPGRFPDDQIFELPGLVSNIREGMLLYAALLGSNSLRGYSDYYVLGSLMNANAHVFSRRPIKVVGDLKGMKVRISGAVIGQTVKELGAVPILMPPTEVVEAMGRGTIDATTTVPAGVIDFGIDRVATHDYLIPLGTNPFAILMTRKKYESLSAEAKNVLAKYAPKLINQIYVDKLSAYSESVIEKFREDKKRTVVSPSEADLAAIRAASQKVTEEWEAKSPQNAELLSKARAILADVRAKK